MKCFAAWPRVLREAEENWIDLELLIIRYTPYKLYDITLCAYFALDSQIFRTTLSTGGSNFGSNFGWSTSMTDIQ